MTEWMDKIPYDSQSETFGDVHQVVVDIRREGMKGADCSVLILGDSGTSFGGIVRTIQQTSKSQSGPFLITTFPTEEELRATSGGTVWIKHVENLNYERQETLTRLIQRSEGVRFIVSGTRSLEEGLAHGKTHPEFYRLVSGKIIYLPRLSSRTGEELVKLAHFIASKMCVEQGRVFQGFDAGVEEFFQKYSWPGNESELVSLVERSLVLAKGNKKVTMAEVVVLPDSVGASGPLEINPPLSIANSPSALEEGYTELKKHFSDVFEKEFLVASLKRHTGNVSQAAREAKLDRSNYLRLLRRHNIKSESFRRPGDIDHVATVTEIKKAA